MNRLNVVSAFALVVVGIWTCALATLDPQAWLRPVQLVVGLLLVATGSYLVGIRRSLAQVRAVCEGVFGAMPNAITFHEDDDGHRHALVTTHGGDVRTIALPDEIDPQQAIVYVMRQLVDGAET